MKVEIGESLIRSWLRHIENCELAELNWKPSPLWEKHNVALVERYFEKGLSIWPEAFGKNKLQQLLKQSEVDVLGLSYGTGRHKVHLVDIAFHSKGLIYGSKDSTAQRVYKKLVRSALISLTYFTNSESTIYFVSPVVTPATSDAVIEACNRAMSVFDDTQQIKFCCILNHDFKTQILDEVLSLSDEVADTSELFLRSWQLIKPFQNLQSQEPEVDEIPVENNSLLEIEREKVLTCALYLSKYGHQHLGLGNQGETIRHLAQKLNVPANTLKNYRDRFDRYVDNHRVGWDAPLTPKLKSVFEKYGCAIEADLRALIVGPC